MAVQRINDILYKLAPDTTAFKNKWQKIIGDYLHIIYIHLPESVMIDDNYDNLGQKFAYANNYDKEIMKCFPKGLITADSFLDNNFIFMSLLALLKVKVDLEEFNIILGTIYAICYKYGISPDEVTAEILNLGYDNFFQLIFVYLNKDNVPTEHYPETYIAWMFAHNENILFTE